MLSHPARLCRVELEQQADAPQGDAPPRICNYLDQAERCLSAPTGEAVGAEPWASSELECLLFAGSAGAAAVTAACAHTGVLMSECIVDVCEGRDLSIAQGMVAAAHDLAVELRLSAEQEVVVATGTAKSCSQCGPC